MDERTLMADMLTRWSNDALEQIAVNPLVMAITLQGPLERGNLAAVTIEKRRWGDEGEDQVTVFSSRAARLIKEGGQLDVDVDTEVLLLQVFEGQTPEECVAAAGEAYDTALAALQEHDDRDDDEREGATDQEGTAAALEREWQDSEQNNRGLSDN